MCSSHLGVDPGVTRALGQILVNDSSAKELDNSGPRTLKLSAWPGLNKIEAHLLSGAVHDGFWRFDFGSSPSFQPGSIKVESGEIIAAGPRSVVFKIGKSTTPLRFEFFVRGPRRSNPPQ